MLRRLLPVVVALAATPALAGPAGDEAAIRHRLADWVAAFNARDAAGACDLFAPDLRYAVPGETRGTRETMCGNLARALAPDDLRLRYDPPDVHEVMLAGDLAVVRLTWPPTAEAEGETETTTEEGMDVFRRQPDGRWSIARFVAFDPAPDARRRPKWTRTRHRLDARRADRSCLTAQARDTSSAPSIFLAKILPPEAPARSAGPRRRHRHGRAAPGAM